MIGLIGQQGGVPPKAVGYDVEVISPIAMTGGSDPYNVGGVIPAPVSSIPANVYAPAQMPLSTEWSSDFVNGQGGTTWIPNQQPMGGGNLSGGGQTTPVTAPTPVANFQY
jgi:hypothetical protein